MKVYQDNPQEFEERIRKPPAPVLTSDDQEEFEAEIARLGQIPDTHAGITHHHHLLRGYRRGSHDCYQSRSSWLPA